MPDDHILCLGCMSFGSSRWRSWVLDEPDAMPLLDAAVESGIRMFDTANVYSGGESERLLGRFIRSRGLRDDVFVASKLFYDTPERLGMTGLGRDNIIASAELSLSRLGIDSLDLLQIHRWDPDVPIEETLAAFDILLRSGKVKAIGASNLAAWQLAKAQIAATAHGLQGFSYVQPHYNLLYREDERDLIPLCRDQRIKMLPWSPLARGRLARQQGASSERAKQDDVAGTLYGDTGEAIVAALRQVAQQHGEAPATIALAWLIGKDMIPIFGATRRDHIIAATRSVSVRLTPDQIALLEHSYRALPPAILPYTARNQAETSSFTISD